MNKDKMEKSYCTAIVLAAGSGKRMGTTTHKQYLLMGGHPVLFYSLRTFQESEFIDEIILVTGKDEQEYCRKEIVDQYGFTKVSRIVEGGKIKSEAGMMVSKTALMPGESREFAIDNTFAIFLKEEGKDNPYFAAKIEDITKFQ